jgi:hypothetical protein
MYEADRRHYCSSIEHRSPLESLASCLRGEPPFVGSWDDIVLEANHHLVAPALYATLARSRALESAPDELQEYLLMLYNINRERNLRLKAQAIEAITALNRVGIEPILLKGSAIILTASDERIGERMVSDLDLMIPYEQMSKGTLALASLGYITFIHGGGHAYANLHRPQDVGPVDLHHRPAGPSEIYQDTSSLVTTVVEVQGSRARIPSATDRMAHLVTHDMINDHHLRCGSIDFRHLLDARDLIGTGQVDWNALHGRFNSGMLQLSLEIYITNLRNLLEVDELPEIKIGLLSRILYWRQMMRSRNRWFMDAQDQFTLFVVLFLRKLRRPIRSFLNPK